MRKEVLATDRVAELNAIGKTLAFEVKVMINSGADKLCIAMELIKVFDGCRDRLLEDLDKIIAGEEQTEGKPYEVLEVADEVQ